MKILGYVVNMFFLSFMYFMLFSLTYYFSIKYHLISQNFTDVLHSNNYAGSISFLFIIFFPIALIPNVNLWLSKINKNKTINKKLLLINSILIVQLPIFV